jgi:hypothetical protein
MSLYCLVYASTALQPFSFAALDALTEASRQRNAALKVTGLLLYRDGDFMQTLEGEQPVVEKLFETIRRDARHAQVTVLVQEPIHARNYGEWSMGLQSIVQSQVQGDAAVARHFERDSTPGQSLARDLMRSFRDGRGGAKAHAAV